MKIDVIRYLIAAVLAVPVIAMAQTSERQCLLKGNVFYQAAAYRDGSASPQQTFDLMHRAHWEGIDDAFLKKAINAVYFDPTFVNAGGQPLMMQMTQLCMHPEGVYKPLE